MCYRYSVIMIRIGKILDGFDLVHSHAVQAAIHQVNGDAVNKFEISLRETRRTRGKNKPIDWNIKLDTLNYASQDNDYQALREYMTQRFPAITAWKRAEPQWDALAAFLKPLSAERVTITLRCLTEELQENVRCRLYTNTEEAQRVTNNLLGLLDRYPVIKQKTIQTLVYWYSNATYFADEPAMFTRLLNRLSIDELYDRDGRSYLFQAILEGDTKFLAYLIRRGVDPTQNYSATQTSLAYAIMRQGENCPQIVVTLRRAINRWNKARALPAVMSAPGAGAGAGAEPGPESTQNR